MGENPEKRTEDTKKSNRNPPSKQQPPIRKQDPREPVEVQGSDVEGVEQSANGNTITADTTA